MTEEQFFEIQFEKFAKIADDNNLTTTFSMYEIADINENSGLLADIMTDGYHNNITLNLPNRKLTWLDLWKYADKLYELIGDNDHLFIETFEVKDIDGKRELQVFFGS